MRRVTVTTERLEAILQSVNPLIIKSVKVVPVGIDNGYIDKIIITIGSTIYTIIVSDYDMFYNHAHIEEMRNILEDFSKKSNIRLKIKDYQYYIIHSNDRKSFASLFDTESNYRIWDNQFNSFCKSSDMRMNLHNGNVHGKFSEGNCPKMEAFQYIGKKDIENNKIYADCSIVEWEHQEQKYQGYFNFNKKYLRYEIHPFVDFETTPIEFFYIQEKSFKIIDTIQENRLGLIKR